MKEKEENGNYRQEEKMYIKNNIILFICNKKKEN